MDFGAFNVPKGLALIQTKQGARRAKEITTAHLVYASLALVLWLPIMNENLAVTADFTGLPLQVAFLASVNSVVVRLGFTTQQQCYAYVFMVATTRKSLKRLARHTQR
jgi:hypothetical protein